LVGNGSSTSANCLPEPKEASEAESNNARTENDFLVFDISLTLAVANNTVPVIMVIILITCAISKLLLAADVEAGSFE